MRALLLVLHKYIGLFLGLLLSITGISGSLIVFDRELDEMLAPHTAGFAPTATAASLDLALANATRAVNNGTRPTRIALAREDGVPHIVRFPTQPGTTGPIEVSIDPGTGNVAAVRTWGNYPVTWLYHLHLSFLGGAAGEYVVGILGICLLFFCISGVVIWWPRNGSWRQAFLIRRNSNAFRLNYDLHKTAGLYFLPVFIVLAFSGIEIVWHEPVEKMVAAVLPVEEYPVPSSTPASMPSAQPPIPVDQAADTARQHYPDSRIARVYLPQTDTAPYQITFTHPDETWNEYSVTSVYVDQYSGKLLAIHDGRLQPAGNRFLNWLFPLHNGDALGLAGRWLVFICGLLPALLFGTGVYMWWRKRVNTRQQV